MKAAELHKRMSNVLKNLITHLFARSRDDIQGHSVHFNGQCVFLLLVIDIPHVNSQASGLCELLAPDHFVVFLQRLLRHFVVLVLHCEVETHTVG